MVIGFRNNVIILFFLLCFSSGQPVFAAEEPFPTYNRIQPNVDFWTKVYTQYTTSQGLMHDSADLSVIYDVLDLKPHDSRGARKINRKRIKAAKAKYQKILKILAANPKADDKDSRRIAELFGRPYKGAVYANAAARLRCQIGQKDRFEAGLIRSGAYIEQIKIIFKSYGLPQDLAYLPHVESSFNPNAYSKFGAAGMWQFTRSTGKRFMKVGYELDERRDPFRSAHAAAQLLKENYAKLGSWPLAITAYNHGVAGLLKAKSRYKGYPEIFSSYRSRIFKFASRNFYSEFLAARSVAENYQAYFGDIVLDRPNPIRTIVLDGYVAFDDICKHFNISDRHARTLNPSLRSPVINGQKYIPRGYAFRLPVAEDLITATDESRLAIPATLYYKKQKPSHFYTVQRGDTAGKIARLHGVRLADLVLANNLNRRATIYPHQTLRIPHPGEPVAFSKTEPVVVAAASRPAAPKPENKAPRPSTVPEKSDTATYPDPILASVIPATKSPMETDAEADAKTWAPETGLSLEIVSADVQFEQLSHAGNIPIGTIRVEIEETLGHYAEWANVRTSKIRRLNNLPFGRVLRLHQKIKIPLNKNTPESFVETRYEFHKRLQEDFFAAYRVGDLQSYTVQRGDNYWTLSREKFDIPMWLLKHCNPETDLADLRYRQKIWIPNIEKATQDDPGINPDENAGDISSVQSELSEDMLALKNASVHTSP
jgi:membrane-bound lytic murein transglycosylase D